MFIHLNLFPLLHTRPTQLFQTNAKIQALGFPWYAKIAKWTPRLDQSSIPFDQRQDLDIEYKIQI